MFVKSYTTIVMNLPRCLSNIKIYPGIRELNSTVQRVWTLESDRLGFELHIYLFFPVSC